LTIVQRFGTFSPDMHQPSRNEFAARAARLLAANPDKTVLVPVRREILFDTETAVTAYASIAEPPFGFLLESVVGGEKWARYTFLGTAPREAWRLADGRLAVWQPGTGWVEREAGDPLHALDARLKSFVLDDEPGLPRFLGGAVGFVGYETVRFIEELPPARPDDLGIPDSVLLFTDTVIAIDNVFGKALVIALAEVPAGSEEDVVLHAYADACARIDRLIGRLAERAPVKPIALVEAGAAADIDFESSYTREQFERDVERVREYINAGDAFQVVLSQRLSLPLEASSFDVYRSLRSLNPSPYMYFLELDDLSIVGSSPEVLVRVDNDVVTVRPIAGTRPRGATDEIDAARAEELRADEKERAEHLMLVDLGRNDVGRVSEFGSVRVTDFMRIERYSHVLHIVSQVEGKLREGLSAVDVLRACFPAGTVSGAPKVRAMEIINELEPVRRAVYAGAVGYFAYGGQTMDTAIAIRTLIARDGRAYVQAGAGIVADSVPAMEYEETLAKARAILRVLGRFRGTGD